MESDESADQEDDDFDAGVSVSERSMLFSNCSSDVSSLATAV